MMDVLLPVVTFVLIAAAVMVWPAPTPPELRRPANEHLLAGLRDFVSRRG
jgi:hypothetical protein